MDANKVNETLNFYIRPQTFLWPSSYASPKASYRRR